MSMQDLPLFYAPEIASTPLLPEAEASHASRVLRMQVGDALLITDGKGTLYEANIEAIGKHTCSVSLANAQNYPKHWQRYITLCVSPTKAIERMEWLLEKATEIGLDRILLLRTKHSERKRVNVERLERILISAMKQSHKTILPQIHTDVSLEEATQRTEGSLRMLLHCRAPEDGIAPRQLPDAHYRLAEMAMPVSIFIGPEGDFSVEEVLWAQSQGFKPTTLGDSRLRTETAALVGLQWLHTLEQISTI